MSNPHRPQSKLNKILPHNCPKEQREKGNRLLQKTFQNHLCNEHSNPLLLQQFSTKNNKPAIVEGFSDRPIDCQACNNEVQHIKVPLSTTMCFHYMNGSWSEKKMAQVLQLNEWIRLTNYIHIMTSLDLHHCFDHYPIRFWSNEYFRWGRVFWARKKHPQVPRPISDISPLFQGKGTNL